MRSHAFLLVLLSALFAAAAPAQHPIDPGPWTTASKVPDGWTVHRTRYYEIQSECGEEKAERLGEHMEVMNKVYRRLFRPGKGGAKKQVIKLFKDQNTYLAYGRRFGVGPGAAAYYARFAREMVCYDSGKWSDEEEQEGPLTGEKDDPVARLQRRLAKRADLWKMDLLGCAAHEGWHQYFAWYTVSIGEDSLPSWINEGMGDYFYTASPKEVSGRKIPAQLGRLNEGRLMVLKIAMKQDRFVPLEQLLTMSKQEFYSNPSVCYAEGWAFCQFLLHSGNRDYEKVIPLFIRYVRDTTDYDEVRERVFRRIDMQELEAEFKAWIEGLEDPGENDGE